MESAQPADERIKACYLTAKLVHDDTELQRKASDTNILARCMEIVKLGDLELHSTDSKDSSTSQSPSVHVGPVIAGRMVEAGLTAIAALCAFHEPAKQKAISLGILPLLNRSLHSSAYSTRTAACQVARVLSRSIAILRTTLVDSGVAKSVVELLRAEEQIYAANGGYEKDDKNRLSASGAVLTAATATICNLICEFPPMQTVSGLSRTAAGVDDNIWHHCRLSSPRTGSRLWFDSRMRPNVKSESIQSGRCVIWSSRAKRMSVRR